eukprot:Gregarina_sp_Pseudo_9__5271@NODE_603_length_2508_cov_8_269745_g569_i0_p2_GENE_NODE_603_length_2508_cov_8_269745_g569_i0NODE_603_length_2508_cov_8_269745_g569_i0_p2_ORF_typecomplete_len347_score35_63_NODE_603_length_2508_cov_8_269745_g569_i014352475
MQQILLFPCEVCVPSDTFNAFFAPQAQRPQSGYAALHWDLNPDTDQITLTLDAQPNQTLQTLKKLDLQANCWICYDVNVCHIVFQESVGCKVLSVLTRFLRQSLKESLGSIFILSSEALDQLTDSSIRSLPSPQKPAPITLDYPEFLDPQPDVPLPVPTEHAETLIRKLAMKNKPGALRITLTEDGAQFDAEKLPRMNASKLAEVMAGSRRPRFYLIRGLFSCAFLGYLSRSTRDEKPQLAIQSHIKYIGLCRAIRLIPGGGLRISRFVRYRHQVDGDNLATILEEINLEVLDKKRPVSLYSLKAPYTEDLMSTYDAEETYITELAHRDFVPIAHPQLSQPVIEPS